MAGLLKAGECGERFHLFDDFLTNIYFFYLLSQRACASFENVKVRKSEAKKKKKDKKTKRENKSHSSMLDVFNR
jgi:hypothetical protein